LGRNQYYPTDERYDALGSRTVPSAVNAALTAPIVSAVSVVMILAVRLKVSALRHKISRLCIVNIENDAFAFRLRSVRFASQRYHHKNSRTSHSKPNRYSAPEMVCIP
jgi:hypothetical protein